MYLIFGKNMQFIAQSRFYTGRSINHLQQARNAHAV